MAVINTKPSKNVYVAEAYPGQNFSVSPNLFISRYTGVGDIYRTLMQFDLSYPIALIPSSSTIDSAKLQLTIYRNEISSGNITANVYRLLDDFVNSSVTWDTKPPASAVSDGSATIASGFTGVLEIVLTNLVRGWYDGSIVNNGIVITGDEANNALVGFRGTEYPDSSTWPKLVISYVDGILVVYADEILNVPLAGTVNSTAISLGGRQMASFLIRNTGLSVVDVKVQVSNDGTNFVDTGVSSTGLAAGTGTITLSTNAAAAYARVSVTGVGVSTVVVSASTREN